MVSMEGTLQSLAAIPDLRIREKVPLAGFTRFGIGGPADALIESASAEAFMEALRMVRASGAPFTVIGGGSNLIVADAGFHGIVLKFGGATISISGERATAEGGAVLQDLVDRTIAAGLSGIHTMTGVPGSVGGAVYGNAGAYGGSIAESTDRVRFFDGERVREFGNTECEFEYRESVFKRHKDWIVLAVELCLRRGQAAELQNRANEIRAVRDAKYPPKMKCAGSIFKNYLFAQLPQGVAARVPPELVKGGKVPSAFFLEQVGAKGMRLGEIQVADYHANLIYNAGNGTARDLVALIGELKHRIGARFGIPLEEEVQYVGEV